jgi:hypothetical protein
MKMTPGKRHKSTRTLIVPVMLAALAWALPAKADSITFNPTGGGAGAGAVSGISGFNYASSSVLAFGLTTPTVGATFQIYYESVLSGTQGTGVTVGPDFNINGSGREFTVIAGFSETITAITPTGGGGSVIAFSLASSPSSPNFFQIYANAPGSANPTTGNGAGFSLGTLVMAGTVSPTHFNGSFNTDGTIGPFNTSGKPTADTTPSTLNGGGGTALTVNTTFQNAGYFPTAIAALTFSTTNSLPFNTVAPLTGFYSTPGLSAPDLVYGVNYNTGTVNAVNGQSLMFQSVANNGFLVVPEPASIIQAVTAAIAIPSLALLRRLRRSKRSAA